MDFSAMQVGDEREIGSGPWDHVRHVFDECMAYVAASPERPRPQFQFDEIKERTRNGDQRWTIRRIR